MGQAQLQEKAIEALEADENIGSSNIKSVRVAYAILEIVARNAGPLSLKMISDRAGISPSKAHRYVQTLCGCGLLSQAYRSGSYDLGMNALRIGLAAVNRVDAINRAGEALTELSNEIEADVFITVWSNLGPTAVRFERWRRPAVSMVGPGTAFPLLNTATGMIFLAFGSAPQMDQVVQAEIRKNPAYENESTERVIEGFAHLRKVGYAYTQGSVFPGRQCASAPILSLNDKLIAAVSFVSTDPDSVGADSRQIRSLVEFCRYHSLPKSGYSNPSFADEGLQV